MSTSRRLPEETSRLSANDGTAQIAAALDAASRDPSLAPDVRLLLAQARDALHAASTDAETARLRYHALDRKSVVEGKSVAVRVKLGGTRTITKKKNKK